MNQVMNSRLTPKKTNYKISQSKTLKKSQHTLTFKISESGHELEINAKETNRKISQSKTLKKKSTHVNL
jgi:hypothetical protein